MKRTYLILISIFVGIGIAFSISVFGLSIPKLPIFYIDGTTAKPRSALDFNFLAGDLTTTGNLSAASATLSGNLDVTGTGTFGTITDGTLSITGGDLTTTGNLSAATGTFTEGITAVGTIRAWGIGADFYATQDGGVIFNATGASDVSFVRNINFNSNDILNVGDLTVSGDITATGTITAGGLTTTGDLSAASSTLSGNLDVTGTGTFGTITDGTLTITGGVGTGITSLTFANDAYIGNETADQFDIKEQTHIWGLLDKSLGNATSSGVDVVCSVAHNLYYGAGVRMPTGDGGAWENFTVAERSWSKGFKVDSVPTNDLDAPTEIFGDRDLQKWVNGDGNRVAYMNQNGSLSIGKTFSDHGGYYNVLDLAGNIAITRPTAGSNMYLLTCFKETGAMMGYWAVMSSGEMKIRNYSSNYDIVFAFDDGGTSREFRIDSSDAELDLENGKITALATISGANTLGPTNITGDNQKIIFGEGQDASIYYDGTDLIIDPDEVGSGLVFIDGGLSAGTSTFGDGGVTNYLTISNTGVVSLVGTAKRDLTLRADLDYTLITAQGKPTQATIGVVHGYSMPIYNNDNEELFFNENVPGRWDGASDIKFHVLVALALAETADETFKFQLSWNQVGETDVVPATTHDTTDEIIVVDGTQYATYMLEFTIDYNIDAGDVILPHDDLAARLRRVASTGDEVDGEIIVLDWHTHYTVDKMFKAPE